MKKGLLPARGVSLEGWMARHAPDNKTTSAVNRTPAFKVSTAWDVAGDASEHAATMMCTRRACAWQIESGGRRIDRLQALLRWVRDRDASAGVLLLGRGLQPGANKNTRRTRAKPDRCRRHCR